MPWITSDARSHGTPHTGTKNLTVLVRNGLTRAVSTELPDKISMKFGILMSCNKCYQNQEKILFLNE